MKRLIALFRTAFRSWREDKATRLGAALAYYTVFSIPPLLILLIGLAGLVFDHGAVRGRFVATIEDLVGPEGAVAIRDMLASAQGQRHGLLATIVGIATLLLGASGVFGHLKDALDTVWGVEPGSGRGPLAFARKYVFSVLLLLGTGFLLIVSLAVDTLLTAVGDSLGHALPGGEGLWRAVNAAFSLTVITVLFALMYKYIPDARVAWSDALTGGLVTSVLFTIGETLIGFYLGRTNVGSAFGAAGSLVVVLVWVYYSAMIFFFGAEFTKTYAMLYGRRIEPEEGAEWVEGAPAAPIAGASPRGGPAG